jgi:beta-phosphoglucomutase-like phosphatase (HAD superfamily)
MLKAVIFDLDNTLVTTKKTKYKTIRYAAKKFYNLDIRMKFPVPGILQDNFSGKRKH